MPLHFSSISNTIQSLAAPPLKRPLQIAPATKEASAAIPPRLAIEAIASGL
jgi:hypothetical protein